ncbi:hypothetical protein D3C86_1984240 [compost metagenome]
MNTLPAPSSDSSTMPPPISRESSLLMDRPRPVPPYLRLVVPSACRKASNTRSCLSSGMPMPLSLTAIAK